MKKLLTTSLLVVFIVISASSQTDKDYGKTLEKLLKLAGTEETFKTAINQIFTMFTKQYPEVDEKTWADLKEEFLKTSLNELMEIYIPIYKKYLTEDDLKELITFYKTPVGRKYAEYTPIIVQESMIAGQEWGQKIGRKFQEKMKTKGN